MPLPWPFIVGLRQDIVFLQEIVSRTEAFDAGLMDPLILQIRMDSFEILRSHLWSWDSLSRFSLEAGSTRLPPRNCRMLCQEWGDSKVVQRRPVDCLMTQIPPGRRCSTQDAAKLNCCSRNPQRMNNALSRTNARQQTPCTRGEANQDTICQNTNKAMKQSNSTKYKASPKHYRPAN